MTNKQIERKIKYMKMREKVNDYKERLTDNYHSKDKVIKYLKKYLDRNFETLRNVELTKLRSDMEYEYVGKTSYPAMDWQQRLVSFYNVFALIFGIIDARGNYYKDSIDFDLKFDKIEKEKIERLKELNDTRDIYFKIFEELEPANNIGGIKDILKFSPSYKMFFKLMDIEENYHTNLCVAGRVISAYMEGFNNSMFFSPEDILDYFHDKLGLYIEFRNNNKNTLDSVKSLKKKNVCD